ncbi:LOW QUALITY PROTEIN: hypothetical protein TorRG33x02_010680 [Trema orientale]|uniref:Uncharacterized protein n=1 Tax=Trema orientale TaxID=63057 RepID=A0A2P5FZ15_TREOI|nr:LOW QUALITY PROTEIN: hypothetical protein TorRG33x02_010680 [Trema orientale]
MKHMAVSTGCDLLLSSLFIFREFKCGDSKLKGLDLKFQRHNSEQQFMYLYAKLYSSGASRKVRTVRSKNFCKRHRQYSMKYKLWELHLIGKYD